MTLEEKRQYRNRRCGQFLRQQNDGIFVTFHRLGKDYTKIPAHEVHELAEATGKDFNDLVSQYGFGSAVITFEVMDHYYHEMGNGSSIGAVAMAQ